jgi:PAS domain S-box-containing protein
MKDAAAIQFMVLDMLGNIMVLSETPAKMGIYLTQQIRQLVGARIVMLIQYTGWESSPDFRVISVEPERHRGTVRLAGLSSLVPRLRNLEEGVLWSRSDRPGPALAAFQEMGCESLIAIPLSMASEPVGALLALDLLEMERNEDVLRSLEILAPFVAMVIRNAFYYENLESEIQIRTKELAESEWRFRNLAEAAPVGIFHLDPQGRLSFVNEQWRQITGIQWLTGPPEAFHHLIHPEDRERVARLWQEAHASRREFHAEYRLLRSDGSTIWIVGQAVLEIDEAGQPTGVIGTLANITARKEAEEILRESEARFRRAIEEAPMPVMIHAEDGEVITLSRTWTELTGYQHSDIPTISEWTKKAYGPTQPVALAKIATLYDSVHRNAEGEFEVTCSDGTQRIWDFSSNSMGTLPDGRRIAMSTASDVTQRKREEEEKSRLQALLQQSQKMESLGSLAGGVAHDMNNVLGAVLGIASANLDLQPMGSPAYRAFDTIVQAATRGGKMVKSLLSFARQSPVEERGLDMNGILRENATLLERTTLAKVRLEMDLASPLRPILGDAATLAHAVMNLCVNAVDAMPEDGTLILRTRNMDSGWIEVTVEDTGTGMPKEVLAKAVDPFFTTKPVGKGTGLGLSMVYSTVKAHRGQMEILSNPGQGTRVMMRFPACETVARSLDPVVDVRLESLHRVLNVLVVDDDELIQSSVLAILDVLGHHATGVSSGEEALAKLEAGFQPDLVVLDLNMPGLGGAGTLPRLRALNPTVPVMITTGRVDQFAMNLVGAYQNVSLLPKPYSIGELKEHLKPLCHG